MEQQNLEANFHLTLKITLKDDIVKKAKTLKLNIDSILDEYISNNVYLEKIYNLIEQYLKSNKRINSIQFIKNETLIDTYSDDCLDISCQCIATIEDLFYINKNNHYIENYLTDTSFWFNQENMYIEEVELANYQQ